MNGAATATATTDTTAGAHAHALGRRSPIGDVARAALAASVERLVRLDAALRLRADEETVHDARVAVRRLRSDLRTFLPVLDAAWARELSAKVRWLQDGFAAARDADVLLARLRCQVLLLPGAEQSRAGAVLAPLSEAREQAYESMRAMLRDPRYEPLLAELAAAAHSPAFGAAAGDPACEAIGGIVGGAWSALRKRVRTRSRPPSDSELHAIRIAAKRVRYAAEAVAPVAGKPARALAHAAERMQTVLGDEHDAAAARDTMSALADDRERAFVAGALAALEHRAACDSRAAWRDAWRAAKRARRRLREEVEP